MAKTLIIAEKPSVAADIARALGGFKKTGEFFESEDYVLSSAVGHLVELFMPEDFDPKFKSWTMKTLPIIPEKFGLKPTEDGEVRYKLLKKLMGRKDVSEILNACDAGREGELIFTYIYELAGCKKPFRRLWWSSMTKEAIRGAFTHPRSAEEMRPLGEAARCRSESDWLVGINGTRALTSRMGRYGGLVASVGRVQTPTLSLLVEREYEIRAFRPRDFWRVLGNFQLASGSYEGIYQQPNFKRNENDEHDRADRLWQETQAQRICAEAAAAGFATITEEKKRTTQIAPRLFDLTTLQREANGRFGLPARRTLSITQSLYERYKAVTYPRTDSRALPEDYATTVQRTLSRLTGEYGVHAAKVVENRWVNPNSKRIFNNAEVSDHFAIIPTDEPPEKLPPDEEKIYDMIVRRFVAVFYPSAEFDVTTRLSVAAGHTFKTEGKVLVFPGWLGVYDKAAATDEVLVPVTAPDGSPPRAQINEIKLEAEKTRPPPRYTEATLLAAMEGAGKLVEDEDLAEAMKEKGLGTPATRASIIEHIIALRYVERQQRELIPTTKAESLMEFLKAIKIEELTSPALTGEWEYQLRKIEEGKLTRDKFMAGIAKLTRQIVERTRDFDETKVATSETDIIYPGDGKPLLETFRTFRSQDGKLAIYKVIGNRKIAPAEVRELLANRKIGPIDGFRSKKGRPFSAILRLDEENKVKFVFENSGFGDNADGTPMDLTQFEIIGKCPVDGAPVHETPSGYVCANYSRGEGAKCGFRVSRVLLGATVPREQFQKLLENKKTDLIKGFKSKRTGRFFEAFLVLKDEGKIGFEFLPRKPKGEGKGKGFKGKTPTAGAEAAASETAAPAEVVAPTPEGQGKTPSPLSPRKGQTPPVTPMTPSKGKTPPVTPARRKSKTPPPLVPMA
jgi:DNA topoisomerase-3